MLGHHPLLARELRKKGRRAMATVLEANRTHYTETWGNDSLVSNTAVLWKLTMRVEPEDELPFEANVDVLLPQTWSPSPGTHFMVLYDPSDHGRVVVDDSEEAKELLDQMLDQERSHERAERWRAGGESVLADRYERIHDPELGLFGPLPKDRDERKRVQAERRAKIKEIMGAPGVGGPTIVVGGRPVQPGQPVASGVPADPGATADALTKLADLRDRGVLTEDEFQAQKKKVLGE